MGRSIPVKPIVIDDLFELNPDYEVVSFDGEVMIIDNWYKNYDKILEVMKNQTPVLWNPGSNDGKNGVDYYDGRVVLTSTVNNSLYNRTLFELSEIIGSQINFLYINSLVFNYWKGTDTLENNIQAAPHTDRNSELACVIYLDKICSGGTMLYDLEHELTDGSGVVDIDNFSQTSKIKPKRLIEAKPNRMVIYPSKIWHGAFVEDHSKYVDDWRINQVHFINIDNNKNNKE
jgi:hypothetical protein